MKGRILVVEPFEPIRELLRVMIAHSGHDVLAVETGNEAIAAMEQEHFPCVVVGSPVVVLMGEVRVFFLEYIERYCPQWRPCLVVVTTHIEAGQVVALSERLKVRAVLAKPFGAGDLLDVINSCLAGDQTPTRWIGIPGRSSRAGGTALSPRASTV